MGARARGGLISFRWLRARALASALATPAVVLMASAVPARAQQAEQEEAHISEARALFTAGRVAFEDGRFESALRHFEASYELSSRAELLYNIAQCQARLHHDAQAIAAFERYLAAAPNAAHRPAVEARLQELRDAQAKAAPATVETMPVVGPATSTSSEVPAEGAIPTHGAVRLGPALTIGSGALLAAVGGVLMVVGHRHGSDVEDAKLGASYSALRADLDSANVQWKTGQALLGIGAVAAGAGVAWLVIERRQTDAALPARGAARLDQVRLSVLPTGLRLSGSF